MLYNGIRLESPWPPRVNLTLDPPALPSYLVAPPEVIPIDVGRQLFVDDFLIHKTGMARVFHPAQYHPASPVLKPDKPWEQTSTVPGGSPVAMPFSDGVFPQPGEQTLWGDSARTMDRVALIRRELNRASLS